MEDAILGTIRGKMNRLGEANYGDIHEFLCQILDSGRTDFLRDFMKLVFEKATRQEAVCGLCVRLLCELSSKYDVLRTELLERYRSYGAIFSDIGETAAADYEAYLEENAEKKYRLGYSQFLAEMLKYTVIDATLFVSTLESIVTNIQRLLTMPGQNRLVEEYTDCLLRLMQAIQRERSEVAMSLRPTFKVRFLETLRGLAAERPTEFPCQTQLGRFTMEAVVRIVQGF